MSTNRSNSATLLSFSMLVSQGAYDWAVSEGMDICEDKDLHTGMHHDILLDIHISLHLHLSNILLTKGSTASECPHHGW